MGSWFREIQVHTIQVPARCEATENLVCQIYLSVHLLVHINLKFHALWEENSSLKSGLGRFSVCVYS